MTSEPSILLQRIRRLSQALMVSGALNIGVLSFLLFWMLKERPPTPYCELKPASYEQQQTPSADHRGCTEALKQLSQLSFPELVMRLANTQMIEDGYAERDLALACLTTFHYFDLSRALPRNGQPQQKRYFAWKRNAQEASIPLVIYPDLKEHQFEAIIQFADAERWPFTSEGLFLLLQGQKQKNGLSDNLVETIVLTPEFWTAELLFNRSGQHLSKQEILTILLEGDWQILKQFVEQQRQVQDSSDARRQKFLLDYVKGGSPSAAILLLKMEWDFAVKKLDDQQVAAILQLMTHDFPESERFAKEMLASPRSSNVWRKASEWLYAKAGEPFPDQWEYQAAVARFIPEQREALPPLKHNQSQATVDQKPISKPLNPMPIKNVSPPEKQGVAPPVKPLLPRSAQKGLPPEKPAILPKELKPSSPLKTKKDIEKKPAKAASALLKQHSYVVQGGDSLWKIARRFGVKIEEIRKINGLQSDNLKPGTSLKIPSKDKK